MDLPHIKKFENYTLIQTDVCQGQCYSTDDFYYCVANCQNKTFPVPPPSSPHHKLPTKFLIAGLVPGISLLVLFGLIIYYKFYTGPRRTAQQEQRNETHEEFLDEDHGPVLDHPIWYVNTVGLQPSVINAITVCKFKKGDGLVEGTDCSVCLNEFQEDETLRLLPKCSHAFHVPCIDTWLRSHTNCPMCRAPIVAANPATAASASSGTSGGGDGGVGGEETQIEVEENREESDRGIGSGDGELRIEIEEGELHDENRRKRGEEEGIQPLRRSVSLDSLSAFRISQALANIHSRESDRNSETGLVKESESNMGTAPKRVGSSSNQSLLKFMASSSIGRSLQMGPSTLKRSLSCGGKLFLQRYSRNSSSVLPL